MNIIVALKVVPDDQDIIAGEDGSLDLSKARPVISEYDANAIEAAAKLAESQGDSVVRVVTVGPASIDDSKLKKNILARGVDELFVVADDAASALDTYATTTVISKQIASIGDFDIVICGDGSADNYAQQVDVQLAWLLNAPSVNGVVSIEAKDGCFLVTRRLEDTIEEVELPMPCVVAVSPDVAIPRIPGMKDILQAGKRPMNVKPLIDDIPACGVEVVSVCTPAQHERKREILNADADGAIERFAMALKSACQ